MIDASCSFDVSGKQQFVEIYFSAKDNSYALKTKMIAAVVSVVVFIFGIISLAILGLNSIVFYTCLIVVFTIAIVMSINAYTIWGACYQGGHYSNCTCILKIENDLICFERRYSSGYIGEAYVKRYSYPLDSIEFIYSHGDAWYFAFEKKYFCVPKCSLDKIEMKEFVGSALRVCDVLERPVPENLVKLIRDS